MADEPISGAPGGGAPTAGGGDSAPSSPAPAAPAAQPTAPVTPAAAAPTAPATPVPSGQPVTKQPGEDDQAFLDRLRKAGQIPTGDEKPPEPKPAEPAKPVAAAEPAKPVEAPKPAVEPEKPIVPTVDVFDSVGPLPASKFAELLDSNPDLAKAIGDAKVTLESGQEVPLREVLDESLRSAGEVSSYREVFPDVDTAKFARQQAEGFAVADMAASNLKRGDATSTRDFVQKVLMPMSYVLDEEGQPLMQEIEMRDGSKVKVPQTDGTVSVMLDNFRDLAVEQAIADAEYILDQAKGDKDQTRGSKYKDYAENLQAALTIVKNHFAGTDPSEEDESPAIKVEREKLKSERQALDDSKRQDGEQRFKAFVDDTQKETDAKVDTRITGWLDQSSLAILPTDSAETKASKEFIRSSVTAEIRKALLSRLSSDQLFIARQEQYGRRGASPKTKEALVSHYLTNVEKIMGTVAPPILAKAGHERVRQSAARSSKIAAQEHLTKMDPVTASQPARPPSEAADDTDLMRTAREQLLAETKREPQPEQTIARWRQLVAARKTAQPA